MKTTTFLLIKAKKFSETAPVGVGILRVEPKIAHLLAIILLSVPPIS